MVKKWFAWRPVVVKDFHDKESYCWLEWVERDEFGYYVLGTNQQFLEEYVEYMEKERIRKHLAREEWLENFKKGKAKF